MKLCCKEDCTGDQIRSYWMYLLLGTIQIVGIVFQSLRWSVCGWQLMLVRLFKYLFVYKTNFTFASALGDFLLCAVERGKSDSCHVIFSDHKQGVFFQKKVRFFLSGQSYVNFCSWPYRMVGHVLQNKQVKPGENVWFEAASVLSTRLWADGV